MDEENLTQSTDTPVVEEKKGFSVASLVLGIISILLSCTGIFAIILAILSIIFGIFGIKKGGKGMAIAGIILSSLALIIAILFTIIFGAAFLTIFNTAMNNTISNSSYYTYY